MHSYPEHPLKLHGLCVCELTIIKCFSVKELLTVKLSKESCVTQAEGEQ